MLRSMTSAASALRFHQTFMDVVANNIANVNTTAFKSGRVTFQEMMNQILSSGIGPEPGGDRGGVNPVQIGMGVLLGGVDTQFLQGGLQATGRTSDLAIQGNGFFIFQGPNQQYYSRDGTLDIATDGTLVNPNTGLRVLGWQAQNGTVDPSGPLTPITISLGSSVTARATTAVRIGGNLNSAADVGEITSLTFEVYDSMGTGHYITISLTKSATNAWDVTISENDDTIDSMTGPTPASLTFDAQGQIVGAGTLDISVTLNNGADPMNLTLDLSTVTQLADNGQLVQISQDGSPAGSLVSFDVTANGMVMGVYSNGMRQAVGQIALATFRNPAGLLKIGQNMFAESANSGDRVVGIAGQGDRGQISSGYLEMSNVDLATQFTDMIRAQRGFQANSRVITASDQMLQELVNIIR
ncbi:MAG: flagellar hook protein FlgE [Anaerolineae bacterium]